MRNLRLRYQSINHSHKDSSLWWHIQVIRCCQEKPKNNLAMVRSTYPFDLLLIHTLFTTMILFCWLYDLSLHYNVLVTLQFILYSYTACTSISLVVYFSSTLHSFLYFTLYFLSLLCLLCNRDYPCISGCSGRSKIDTITRNQTFKLCTHSR